MRKNMLLLALFSLGVSLQINQLISMKEQPPSYEEPTSLLVEILGNIQEEEEFLNFIEKREAYKLHPTLILLICLKSAQIWADSYSKMESFYAKVMENERLRRYKKTTEKPKEAIEIPAGAIEEEFERAAMTARSEPSLGEGPGYYPLRLVESEPVLLSPSKYSREKELITGKIKSFIIDNPTARELFVEEVNQFFDPYFMARLDQLIKGFFRDNDQADQE